jgi:hypothetical protein
LVLFFADCFSHPVILHRTHPNVARLTAVALNQDRRERPARILSFTKCFEELDN